MKELTETIGVSFEVASKHASFVSRDIMIAFQSAEEKVDEKLDAFIRHAFPLEKMTVLNDTGRLLISIVWKYFKLACDCHDMSTSYVTNKNEEYDHALKHNLRLKSIEENYKRVLSQSKFIFSASDVMNARGYIKEASKNPNLGVHLMLGLQSLRESPMRELSKLRDSWTKVYCDVQKDVIVKMIDDLNEPIATEEVDWVFMNSYLDGSLGSFRSWLTMRVLSEFYSSQTNWCQGSANLSYAMLAGLKSFNTAREEMNHHSRSFKKNPKRASKQTRGNLVALKKLLMQRSRPLSDKAVYIEFDAWSRSMPILKARLLNVRDQNRTRRAIRVKEDRAATSGRDDPWRSTGGHVFVVHANARRTRFAVYSSWRTSYSLSDWMNDQKMARSVFNRQQFIVWMDKFTRLLSCRDWCDRRGFDLDFLFSCEHSDEDGAYIDHDHAEKGENDEEQMDMPYKSPGSLWNRKLGDRLHRNEKPKSPSSACAPTAHRSTTPKSQLPAIGRSRNENDQLIWECNFAHSNIHTTNLTRNFKSIVRTARKAHHEAKSIVGGFECLEQVNDMHVAMLKSIDNKFAGQRCSYSIDTGYSRSYSRVPSVLSTPPTIPVSAGM